MKRKIYLIQPSYRDDRGVLLKGKKLYTVSLALAAISGAIPEDWEKESCFEYFDDVNLDTDASVIGISSMGYELSRGIELAAEFRRRGKLVLFGGFQPHLTAEYLEDHCDAVVHGNPGRPAMAAILRDAERGTLRREYRCGVDVNHPFDYSVIDLRRLSLAPVLLGVGCRNACDFCCIGSIYGGTYRLRKLSTVLDELTMLRRATRHVAVVDTNAYNNRDYLLTLCREMVRRRFDFVWGAQCTLDVGDDVEVLRALRDAGCRVLFIGMESIDQANMDEVHKRNLVESYRREIGNIHAAGIRIAAFFMYGFDGDTVDTAASMSRFIIEHRIALPMLNVVVPTPGTQMYDRLKAEGRLLTGDVREFLRNNITYNSSFNLCFYQPKHMTPRQVEEGFIDLLGRLSGLRQIVRRSLAPDLWTTLFLLTMNWGFRREYLALRKRRVATIQSHRAESPRAASGPDQAAALVPKCVGEMREAGSQRT